MVLVILAILAAILVPALLGWIDKAKEKNYVLDARNVYIATQAVLDEIYATGESADVPGINAKFTTLANGTTLISDIQKLSDTSFTDITIKEYKTRSGSGTQAEIAEMEITGLKGESNVTATLEDGEWKIDFGPGE